MRRINHKVGDLFIASVDRIVYCGKCTRPGIIWDYLGNQRCPRCGWVRESGIHGINRFERSIGLDKDLYSESPQPPEEFFENEK